MNKVKPIRRLWYQFGGLSEEQGVRLDALEIFEALRSAGVIEGVRFVRDGETEVPTHYREIIRRVPEAEFRALIRRALREYLKTSDDMTSQHQDERPDQDLIEEEQQGHDSSVIDSINRGDL